MENIAGVGPFMPRFYAPPHPPESAPRRPSAGPEEAPIHYIGAQHGTQIEFETNQALFSAFGTQVAERIEVICGFIDEHVKDLPTRNRIKADFKTFKDHVLEKEKNYYGKHAWLIYGQGKEALDTVCRLLGCNKVALDSRMAVLMVLSEAVPMCAGGCLTGLRQAANRLQQEAGGIEGTVLHWKTEMIAQDIAQYVTRNFPECQPGDETHYGVAFSNHMSRGLGLPWSDDPLARRITHGHLDRCTNFVLASLTPVRLALRMAESYLGQVMELPLQHYGSTAPMSFVQANALLDEHLLPISEKFGDVPRNLLIHDSKTDGCYEIGGTVSLIARVILETMQTHGLLPASTTAPAVNAARGQGELQIMQSAHGALFWVEGEDEPEALKFEHLDKIDRRDFRLESTYQAAILQIVTSMPRESLSDMPPAKLSDLDCIKAFLGRWDDWSALKTYLTRHHDWDRSLAPKMNAIADFILDESHSQLVPMLPGEVVERPGHEGNRPLAHYAAKGASVMVAALLRIGAGPNALNGHGQTAMMQAINCGHAAVVRVLASSPALRMELENRAGLTALQLATVSGRADLVAPLLQYGADRGAADMYGMTVLMVATRMRHAAVAGLLLEVPGATALDALGPDGGWALMYALENDDIAIMAMLMSAGADLELPGESGTTVLMQAVRTGKVAAAKLLIDRGAGLDVHDASGWTALMYAAQADDGALLDMLIKAGADLDAQDNQQQTALMQMADRGDTAAALALLSGGASPDMRDNNGWTAMRWALEERDIDIAKLLVKFNADPNLAADDGTTPWGYAVRNGLALLLSVATDQNSTTRSLLDERYALEAQCNLERTALTYALESADHTALAWLIEAGANIDANAGVGTPPLTCMVHARSRFGIYRALECNANIEARDEHGMTALMWVVRVGTPGLLTVLLGGNPDLEAADLNSETALSHAARQGRADMVELLLAHGAAIDARGSDGMTSLMWAAKNNDIATIHKLRQARIGPDLEPIDEYGNSAYDLAMAHPALHELAPLLRPARAGEFGEFAASRRRAARARSQSR